MSILISCQSFCRQN